MRSIPVGVLACLLSIQGLGQTPLQFKDIQARIRANPERLRTETLLADRNLQLQETQGFLREGLTMAIMAGPRRNPGGGSTTDRSIEVDLPLFLSSRTRKGLEDSLGKAYPLLREVANREDRLRLKLAYLDAWLAANFVSRRTADLTTVEQWLTAARKRVEAGADPEFQASLVEGERLKIHQELDEARAQEASAWGRLVALADLPNFPVPLADPGPLPALPTEDLKAQFESSPLRKALLAQAELEAQNLHLKEALSLSRWSIRGSHAQEGDEKVSRLGIAIRFPRPGESAAIRQNTASQIQASQSGARQAIAELEARLSGLVNRLRQSAIHSAAPDFSRALDAISLRLQEGRERPSEALPIRRQLLEAQMVSLRRTHALHVLYAEMVSLLPEVQS